MVSGLLIGIVFLGQANAPAKIEADQFPLALHRNMELDDLDREILRQRDAITIKRSQLLASQRLAQRGVLSRGDLERETADLKYHEAKADEYLSYRALKVYERDVASRANPPDELKAYSLLLDWVRKQGGIAQVDLDFRTSSLKQSRALFAKNAVSRQELDEAELAFNTAEATMALSRSREAQVVMEIAERTGVKPNDLAEVRKLRGRYRDARLRYFEISLEGAARRLEIARERSRKNLIPEGDLIVFERAFSEAEAALEVERKAMKSLESEPPPPPTRNGTPRDDLRQNPGSANVKS